MQITPESKPGMAGIAVRGLIVGFIYALASALLFLIPHPVTLDNVLIFTLTGTLVTLSMSPFILRSNWSRTKTVFSLWAVLAFVRAMGLGIEGSLFKPTTALHSIIGAILGVFIGLLVAWLAVLLLMPANQIPQENVDLNRSWWGWTWRVIAVGLAYFVFYFVFGATNALLYTKPFYENNPQYGLTLPPAGIIFLAQLIRGPLFGLGSLFIVRAANASRRQIAVWLGILLFIVGGFGPYVENTFRVMPLGFNLATLTEILFQNFLTGVVAANLFGQKK